MFNIHVHVPAFAHKFQFASKQIYIRWMLVSLQLNYISVFQRFYVSMWRLNFPSESGKMIFSLSLSLSAYFFSSLPFYHFVKNLSLVLRFFVCAYPRIFSSSSLPIRSCYKSCTYSGWMVNLMVKWVNVFDYKVIFEDDIFCWLWNWFVNVCVQCRRMFK